MTYTQEKINAIAEETIKYVVPGYFFNEDLRNHVHNLCIQQFVVQMKDLVKSLNSECGTRTKKSLETLCSELSRREISWSEFAPNLISVHFGEITISAQYHKGLDIALDFTRNGHPREWVHITTRENDVIDLMECIAASYLAIRDLVEKRYLEAGRDRMISEVEYPGVEKEVADFLVPRGINYTLENNRGENILSIQIIKEIWMRKAVSSEDIEQDLRFVPYLIKRPDCIKRDGRGFAIFHNWNWDKQRK